VTAAGFTVVVKPRPEVLSDGERGIEGGQDDRQPAVRRDGVEETIGQFVVRRFNQEFLDHATDALVAGIYAGDPHKLSVVHAFPKLKALEDNYGSMIKGQILGARERKKRGEVAKDRAPKFSFDEGLQVLPDTLAAQLGGAVDALFPPANYFATTLKAVLKTIRIRSQLGLRRQTFFVQYGGWDHHGELLNTQAGMLATFALLHGSAAEDFLQQQGCSYILT